MHETDEGSVLLAMYDAQAAPCLGLARALLQDPDAAEAAVADAFVSVWQDLRAGGVPSPHVVLARTLLACRPAGRVQQAPARLRG